MQSPTGSNKKTFDKSELVILFNRQLSSIEQFSRIYDEGDEYVSADLAVKLRVMFHNTDNSKSLIKHLKLEHVAMVDTSGKFDPKNLAAQFGLCGFRISPTKEARFLPRNHNLNEVKRVSFESWWHNKRVLKDNSGRFYTRKSLVSLMANKDGGAHVAEFVDDSYYQLTRGKSSGWVLKRDDKEFIMNPVPPSIRQIAAEVLDTFKDFDVEKESKLR